MHAVRGKRVVRLLLSLLGEVLGDRGVQVDHHLDPVLLLHDPLGELGDHVAVVVFVNPEVGKFLRAGRSQGTFSLLQRDRVERRGGHQNELGPGSVDLLDHPVDTILIDLKTFFREGVIDSVVHPVAGDYDVRPNSFQYPVESLVDIRTRKRVGRFGLSRTGLAGKADVVEGGHRGDALETTLGLDPCHEATGMCDRISQKENSLGLQREGDRHTLGFGLGGWCDVPHGTGQAEGPADVNEVVDVSSQSLAGLDESHRVEGDGCLHRLQGVVLVPGRLGIGGGVTLDVEVGPVAFQHAGKQPGQLFVEVGGEAIVFVRQPTGIFGAEVSDEELGGLGQFHRLGQFGHFFLVVGFCGRQELLHDRLQLLAAVDWSFVFFLGKQRTVCQERGGDGQCQEAATKKNGRGHGMWSLEGDGRLGR